MKRTVEVTITVEVEIDEVKFTVDWMAGWREIFYPYASLDEHVMHIAKLYARGLWRDDFVVGYGCPANMGIKVSMIDTDIELLPTALNPEATL